MSDSTLKPRNTLGNSSESRRTFLRNAPLLATGVLAACGQAQQQVEDGHHLAKELPRSRYGRKPSRAEHHRDVGQPPRG